MNKPIYRAEGDKVFQRPIETDNENGTTNISMGFLVCTAGDGVDAEEIAKLLNKAEPVL